MYTLISGSPKVSSSNSMNFLKKISSKIEKYNLFELKNDKYKDILNSIEKSDVILFALPLYVDSPTSITLEFLDYIVDNNIKLNEKLIYVVINCGFRDGKQNIIGINIIKRWCKKVNATYGSSILIGAGEIVGKDKYKFISNNAMKKIDEFSNIVKEKRIENDVITTIDLLNDRMYCFLANLSWSKNGRKNKLSSNDLRII